MRRFVGLVSLLLTVLAACASPAASPGSKQLEPVKLSISNWAAVYAPFLIAIDKGYFAAQGLDVQVTVAAGGLAVPALLSGDVPYTASAATAMGAIIKGAPLKVIYTNADRSVQQLWAASDVKTLDDLKGKPIGVASRGDSNEITLRMLLTQQHIDQSSLSFIAVGSPDNAVAALMSGVVKAGVVGGTAVTQLRKSGYQGAMLYDLSKVQLLYNGLATSDKELQDHRDRAKRLLYGTLQGRDYYRAFKDETLQILGKHAQTPPADFVSDYDTSLAAMTEDGTMPADAQRQDALVRASLIQMAPADVPPVERLYDYSLVRQAYQELRGSGWKPAK